MANLIGLDVGTTGCKAVVFDAASGTLLASANREYPVLLPHPGWAEQDIEAVWELALGAMGEAIATSHVREVAAIGLSVHGEAVTPVDRAGHPLRPTILGMDTRTYAQNEWLRDRFGARRLFDLTGMPVHTINTLPKLLWIKQYEPEVWTTAEHFLLVEDYLVMRMTGRAAISACLASRSQLFDLMAGRWSDEVLATLELVPERLAEIVPSGTPVGGLRAELTTRLGLATPPLVVTGGHDQACGALGVGLTRPGLAMVSTGTAEVVEVAMRQPLLSQPLYEGNVSIYRATVPDLFLAMTLNHSGGIALRWFRDGFCEPQVALAARSGVDAYDLLLAQASAEPSGLLFMPHLAGAGTPFFDTASRGAIVGLTLATSRTDVAKAILEGLTYELRLNLDLLRQGGVAVEILRAIGGGAGSPLWLQLKADISGIPVIAPKVTEAAAFGAALLAGVGAGLWASATEGAECFLEFAASYEPDPARHAAYTRRYELYRELYPALAPLAHQL